jgi:hypothetical protein
MRTGIFAIMLTGITLLFLGCAGDRSFRSLDPQTQSIVVGRIDLSMFPPMNRPYGTFSLYERDKDNKVRLFPRDILLGGKEAQQGYFFKPVPSGEYTLRRTAGWPAEPRDLLFFHVPPGKLVNLGTVKAVLDELYRRGVLTTEFMVMFHTEQIADDSAVRHFQKSYPKTYALYKDKILNAVAVPGRELVQR